MTQADQRRRGRQLLRRVVVATTLTAVTAALILGAFFAGRATTHPIDPVESAETQVTVGVTQQTIERTVSLVARYDWVESTPLLAPAAGVLTASASGTVKRTFEEGDVLARVDERPIVLVTGEVPAYRSMQRGDSGADVRQLNDFLVRRGLLTDGGPIFTRETEQVIKDIQAWNGLEATGIVLPGDFMFVPTTPVVASLELVPGTPVTTGQRMGTTFEPEPRLTIQVSADQSQLLTPDANIRLTLAEGVVTDASVVETTTGADGSLVAQIRPIDGGSVCGQRCADVQSGVLEEVKAQIVVVPQTSGPSVPVGAIRTDAQGQTYVQLADGHRNDVTVRASLDGSAIVDGIDVGAEIILVEQAAPVDD